MPATAPVLALLLVVIASLLGPPHSFAPEDSTPEARVAAAAAETPRVSGPRASETRTASGAAVLGLRTMRWTCSCGEQVEGGDAAKVAHTFAGYRREDLAPGPRGGELYAMQARHYRPGIGRFLRLDPVGFPDGANRFRYVANNPTRFTDPSGKTLPAWMLYLVGWAYWYESFYGSGEEDAATKAATETFMSAQAVDVFCRGGSTLLGRLRGVPAPPTAGPGAGTIQGLYGTVTAAEITEALAAGGPSIRVVTNLTQAPAAGRALSVAYGENAVALAQSAREGGRFFVADIPERLIIVLERAGLAIRRIGQIGSSAATSGEFRFHATVTEYFVHLFRPL